jgi:cysteine desulfurase family protein
MIYLDNAATSFPKPPQTGQAIQETINKFGANPGRGAHQMALGAAEGVWKVREQLARLFGIKNPDRIVFAQNATAALNLALLGGLNAGDHLIITSMEHNAIARPAIYLKSLGVELTVVAADSTGSLEAADIERAIKPNTRMVATIHASNVTGGLMPIDEIGRICAEKEVLFLVDAAQTAGIRALDVERMNIDLLGFPGHKSLYGPTGIGGLYIKEGIKLKPLLYGGTGNQSESREMPGEAPERYEAGTLNTVGIAGLGGGLAFLEELGMTPLYEHEKSLTIKLMHGLQELGAVVSFNISGMDASEAGFILDQVYGIAVRTGLHCAPLAHRTMGTLEPGAIRVSLSYFNTSEDVEALLTALDEMIKDAR